MKQYGLLLNYYRESCENYIVAWRRWFGMIMFHTGIKMRKGPENRQDMHDKMLEGLYGYTPEELR